MAMGEDMEPLFDPSLIDEKDAEAIFNAGSDDEAPPEDPNTEEEESEEENEGSKEEESEEEESNEESGEEESGEEESEEEEEENEESEESDGKIDVDVVEEGTPTITEFAMEVGKDLIATKQQAGPTKAEIAEYKAAALNDYKSRFAISEDDFSIELDSIKLPDAEIMVDGKKVNLSQFEKEYPEATTASKAIAVAIAKKIVDTQVLDLRNQMKTEVFFNNLSIYYPDARLLVKDKNFQSWRESAPEEIQALLNDPDPLKVSLALDYYKEQSQADKNIEKSKKKKVVKKSKPVKKKSKASYKGNLKGSKKPKRTKGSTYDPTDGSDEALASFWDEIEE